MDITTIVISTILGAVGGFFLSYLNERGKNFATKEDIAQITRLQSAVKAEFDAKHETLRSGLDKQSHIHKLAFDREFEILSELWRAFVDLRRSTLDMTATGVTLHPMAESPEAEAEQETKRYQEFSEHFVKFWDAFQKNRPFYSEEIYTMLVEFANAVQKQGIMYIAAPSHSQNLDHWRIQQAEANKIIAVGDSLCNAIRKQILA